MGVRDGSAQAIVLRGAAVALWSKHESQEIVQPTWLMLG
jgi:hypothetical protein